MVVISRGRDEGRERVKKGKRSIGKREGEVKKTLEGVKLYRTLKSEESLTGLNFGLYLHQ